MHYDIAAKPTVYKHVRFRSRLEAKWACMFDQLGWHWEYEPFDLGYWTPDFLLTDAADRPILVEVKPIVEADPGRPLPPWATKMFKAPNEYDLLILGCALPFRAGPMTRAQEWFMQPWRHMPCIGVHCRRHQSAGRWSFSWGFGGALSYESNGLAKALIVNDRNLGGYNLGEAGTRGQEYMDWLWAYAHAQTQWRAPT